MPPKIGKTLSAKAIELEERFHRAAEETSSMFDDMSSMPAALALDEGDAAFASGNLDSEELPDNLQDLQAPACAQPSKADAPAPPKKPKFSPAAKRRILRDKLTFVFSMANLCLSSAWVGSSPQTYYIKFIITMSTLFALRFIAYKPKGQHYYMTEYCYWGNVQLALYFLFAPTNPLIRKVVFGQMAGPITWSIILQRNSMVLHSLDKMTSLAMHLAPALAAWCMRWQPRPEWEPAPGSPAHTQWSAASLVFVFKAKKIAKNNYPTLYTLMTRCPTSPITKFVKLAPEPFQPLMYMSGHAFWTWISLLLTPIWWHSKLLHSAFVVLCLLVSFYNGASYYFSVFATRYIKQLEDNKDD